jgi:hypothetical protein
VEEEEEGEGGGVEEGQQNGLGVLSTLEETSI